MTINFIRTGKVQFNDEITSQILEYIRSKDAYKPDDELNVYTGWPRVRDYMGKFHTSDVTIIGRSYGIKMIRISPSMDLSQVDKDSKSILQAAASTESLLAKSLVLKKNRRLVFDVVPIIYAPNIDEPFEGDGEVEIIRSFVELKRCLVKQSGSMTEGQLEEAVAIIEGAKALGQLAQSVEHDELHAVARAYRDLEAEIYNFDAAQRSVALSSIKGPQRIRGLAGTGKTVILAMKAALAHIDNPNAKILITYYTRSLRDVIERLVTRFHRHFAEVDPDWSNVHVRHGWGRSNLPGVYRDTCIREGIAPRSFGDVRAEPNPFGAVCEGLLASKKLSAYYDVVLVDEGQDFPDSFYQMCFHLTKGSRDEKQIIWAYDELQNVFDVNVRQPEQLFGIDLDGLPCISLDRSLPPGTETNDFVLQKAYRNQRDILVLAHSIGFGVYRNIVQMLEDARHWEDVGYDVITGDFEAGSECVVERKSYNSPAVLKSPKEVPLFQISSADGIDSEVEIAASEIAEFVGYGIKPDEIMVVCLDDRAARTYFSRLSERLAGLGLSANNIISDPFSEPPFRVEGLVTLSTVYRAKGNEAAVVIVLGADAATLETRTGRNKLFVAFTRTKGWLRVHGIKSKTYDKLEEEVTASLEICPRIRFTMPDMTNLNTIQRGLEARHARINEGRRRIERIKSELGLSDAEFTEMFSGG